MKYLYYYLAVINIIAVFITAHDKIAAIQGRRRVSERTLFLSALLGGGPAMYLTMLIIRHKTRKMKFMLGIPAIIILQLFLYMVIRYGLPIF